MVPLLRAEVRFEKISKMWYLFIFLTHSPMVSVLGEGAYMPIKLHCY